MARPPSRERYIIAATVATVPITGCAGERAATRRGIGVRVVDGYIPPVSSFAWVASRVKGAITVGPTLAYLVTSVTTVFGT